MGIFLRINYGVKCMDARKIVKIEYVPVNELWDKEDKKFTPWLKENIDYLNDILVFEIRQIGTIN